MMMMRLQMWSTLQIACASALYSQLVWLPVESMLKKYKKSQIVWLSKKKKFAVWAKHLPENCTVHVKPLFYVNSFHVSCRLGINFVGIWPLTIMPPRYKLSILDHGSAMAWLSERWLKKLLLNDWNKFDAFKIFNRFYCLYFSAQCSCGHYHVTSIICSWQIRKCFMSLEEK